MSSPATDVLGARAKPLPEYVWFPSQQGKPFLNAKNDDMQKKWAAAEEELGLSGVPVRQVQEDLVRDRAL